MSRSLSELMDGFVDAEDAGDQAGYLENLPPDERDKLLAHLVSQIGKILREKEH